MNPLAVAVLASGRGTNLRALLDAIDAGRVPARVCCVISDRADAGALARAHDAGVPAHVIAPADLDAALVERLDRHGAGLVVLAGFMRLIGPATLERWHGRMLNIHPSLLPAYRGLHTHRRVLDAGEREHGASVHFVTGELDGGPVVIQSRVPVLPGDDASTLAARVRAQEHRIYPWTVARFAEGRLCMNDTIEYDGVRLPAPFRVDADTDLDAL